MSEIEPAADINEESVSSEPEADTAEVVSIPVGKCLKYKNGLGELLYTASEAERQFGGEFKANAYYNDLGLPTESCTSVKINGEREEERGDSIYYHRTTIIVKIVSEKANPETYMERQWQYKEREEGLYVNEILPDLDVKEFYKRIESAPNPVFFNGRITGSVMSNDNLILLKSNKEISIKCSREKEDGTPEPCREDEYIQIAQVVASKI